MGRTLVIVALLCATAGGFLMFAGPRAPPDRPSQLRAEVVLAAALGAQLADGA